MSPLNSLKSTTLVAVTAAATLLLIPARGGAAVARPALRIDPQQRLILMLFVQPACLPRRQALPFGFHHVVMPAIDDGVAAAASGRADLRGRPRGAQCVTAIRNTAPRTARPWV